jgi:hypothetical protein
MIHQDTKNPEAKKLKRGCAQKGKLLSNDYGNARLHPDVTVPMSGKIIATLK